jgi:hypothetical protein
LAAFADDDYGRQVRRQFADIRGSSELAMLQSPSGEELEQLKRAVAIMTPGEKLAARDLTDEQVRKIADDAGVDNALFAIFINGFILECKRVL